MLNFIQTFLMGIAGLIFISWFISKSSGWDELSKIYKIEQCSPSTFITNQQVTFQNPDNYRGITVIRPLNIGVSEEGLYLFKPSYDALYPSLLILWNAIDYQKPIEDGTKNKLHTFYIGDPTITSLRLHTRIIEKLEEDYGEPIFHNKLRRFSLID